MQAAASSAALSNRVGKIIIFKGEGTCQPPEPLASLFADEMRGRAELREISLWVTPSSLDRNYFEDIEAQSFSISLSGGGPLHRTRINSS